MGPAKPYRTVRESLTELVSFSWLHRARQEKRKPFWALHDVSFDVEPGEVVGIIGRNGAGKSTLLKILSRITEPTRGRVELHGRVGSLLEVGTGFHPELTGRENIYLNGAILGMRKAEIRQQFDAIVAFAETEAFLDTAVKHYSSGMYTRLAFAVAAHLNPEILVVDEVLAVGDAAFQRKCLGKMGDIAKAGKTVLFVSHNAAAIEALCGRCIWLSEGQVRMDGEPRKLLHEYHTLNSDPKNAVIPLDHHVGRSKGVLPVMREVALLTDSNTIGNTVRMRGRLGIRVKFRVDHPLKPILGVVVKTVTGTAVFGVNNRFIAAPHLPDSARSGAVTCWIEKLPLMPGTYLIDLYFGDAYRDVDVIHQAACFEVVTGDLFGTGQLAPSLAGPVAWPADYEFANDATELAETIA